MNYGAIITGGGESFPLLLYGVGADGDRTGCVLFNSREDIRLSGSLISEMAVRGGVKVRAYSPKTTRSTIEDTGTAQLAGGTSVVRLDPSYAQSIDLQTPYRVFLTADGESRGLYVAQENAVGIRCA